MPSLQRTPQQLRALQLLAEAEFLENSGESLAAVKKYQAAYRLDPELEAASFADQQEAVAVEVAEVANAREVVTDDVPGFDIADPAWMAYLDEQGATTPLCLDFRSSGSKLNCRRREHVFPVCCKLLQATW